MLHLNSTALLVGAPLISLITAVSLRRRRLLRAFVVVVAIILASWILLIDRVDREGFAAYQEEEARSMRGEYIAAGPRPPPGSDVFVPLLFGWLPATLGAAVVIVPQWVNRTARTQASRPGGFPVGAATTHASDRDEASPD